jgi:hypothetical protein
VSDGRKVIVCACCGKTGVLRGRGLRKACYERHRAAKTLDQFPRLGPPGEGVPEIPGVTYRQLDYWARQGYLRPSASRGSGVSRLWPRAEVKVAWTMSRLVAAGIPPSVAARVARGEKEIAPGVKVLVKA